MPSPDARSTRGRRRISSLLSLLVHALAAVLFGAFLKSLLPTPAPTTSSVEQTITISQKTAAPQPVTPPHHQAAPPPQVAQVPPPRPVAPPTPRVLPPHVELPHGERKRPVIIQRPPPAPVVVAPVRHAPPVASAGTRVAYVRPGRRRFSTAQLASIQNDLASAISQDKVESDPLKVEHPNPVATMKDYGSSYGAFDNIGETGRGHGLCDPVTDWTADGFDYYYVACEVHLAEGGERRESVPWPVRFKPNNNPFNGTSHGDVPLAMPLPGWHADANTYISAELRQYAKDNGVTL